MIFIEFTSRFAGKVYPYARIKQRKYIKSPEGLTEIGKVLRALFSLPKSVFKRVTQNNAANSERVVAYDKRKTDELCEIRTRTAEVNQN